MNSFRKIASHYALSSDRLLKNSIITFDAQGVITNIEENVDDIDTRAGVEFYNGILIPGTVNCHCHLEYSYVKGEIPRGSGLPEFIRRIIEIKFNGKTTVEQMTREMDLWDDIMYKEGVVAVGDVDNYNYVFDTKVKSKIYYHSFVEMLDVEGQPAAETFKAGIALEEEAHQRGLVATIVPHANYTMDDDLMALSGGTQATTGGYQAGGIVSVHYKENEELGGDRETLRTLGCLNPNRDVLLIHCIYAKESDMDRAIAKFPKLTVVPCPCSNMFIENRLPDIDMFRRKGLHIALGTDSLSSNDQLSMVEELKCLQRNLPHIPLLEVVKWATLNGAQTLGIADWAGSFEVGKRPGAVQLSGVDLDHLTLTDKTKGKRVI